MRVDKDKIKDELEKIVSKEYVLSEKVDLIPYLRDHYPVKFSEEYRYFPDFVVRPSTTQEVQEIVKLAVKYRIPIIPRGGGTNWAGMVVPISGGIVVDLTRMKKIIEINEVDHHVTVQAGVTLKELDDELKKHGLTLGQEQGSYYTATIGGAIATNGWGSRCNKYGKIGDNVMSLEVVLPNGEILRTCPKVHMTSVPYNLNSLFIGSEGTLGIITEATLRVYPYPEKERAIAAVFNTYEEAKAVGLKIRKRGIGFSGGKVFENKLGFKKYGYPDKKGFILVGFEGTKEEVDIQYELVKKMIIEGNGIILDDEIAWEEWIGHREVWCGVWSDLGAFDMFDVMVPLDKGDEFCDTIVKEVLPKYGFKEFEEFGRHFNLTKYPIFGVTYGISPTDEDWEKYQELLREAVTIVKKFGGTIAACTGTGIRHVRNLEIEYSKEAINLMKAIKKLLDPYNIMNPGKKILVD
ncbi:MAG: FAD-binding oxidoreductase [Nitrososphaeria archaeon]